MEYRKYRIESKNHNVGLYRINKISLSSYGHKNI